jgi:hypothetical protein
VKIDYCVQGLGVLVFKSNDFAKLRYQLRHAFALLVIEQQTDEVVLQILSHFIDNSFLTFA